MTVVVATTAVGCSNADAPRTAAASTTTTPLPAADAPPVSLDELGVDPATQVRCDPLGGSRCLLPWPNDHFTVADPSTDTGRRLAIDPASTPANVDGTHVDVTDQDRADGWSPGSALMVQIADLDAERSRLPGLADIATSLADDSPVVVWDDTARERVPVWAELDALADPAAPPVLFIRPARNFADGHHVVVGLRGLRDAGSHELVASPAFAAYRDGRRTTDATFEARRPAMEGTLGALGDAGVDRSALVVAWDFTVASTRSLTGRMVGMRDAALAELGTASPHFAVTSVVDHPDSGSARQVDGTFEVPLFLTDGGAPGGEFVLGAEGAPIRQEGSFTADFRCELPDAAQQAPVRGALYGHGLMGELSEVSGDLTVGLRTRFGVGYCATNWYGMSAGDIVQVATTLHDLSHFPAVADRLQQGILAFIWLGRLMTDAQGFAADPAFRFGDHAAFRSDELYFDGNSQGAILGGALTAVSPDLTASVLGEAGMNYSTLLDRSVDFDDYLTAVLRPSYPDRFDRIVGVALMQLLWDRGETDGYADHLGERRLPGSASPPVLLLGAVGDHQVTEYALRVEARTIGAAAHMPVAGDGRTVDGPRPVGLTALADGHRGNAYVLWDTGSPPSPVVNTPPREGHDPHDDTPKIDAVVVLKDGFLRSEPTVDDPCAGEPCTAPVPD